MKVLLEIILVLLLVGSFISIFIGLIAPQLYKPLFKRDLGRKKTGLIFFGIFIATFIIIGVFGNTFIAGSSINSSENKVVVKNSPTPQPVRTSPVPTAKPKPKNTMTPKATPVSTTKPTVKPTTTSPSAPISSPTPTDWTSNPGCEINEVVDVDACLREKYPLEATVKNNDFSLYITNTQNVEWTDCNVNFDDNSYGMDFSDTFTIGAGSTASVPWGWLIDSNGNRFDYTKQQPGAVDISCTVNHQIHESQYGDFQ